MASDYVKQTWADGLGGGTPLSGTRLQYMEDGIEDHEHAGGGGGGGGGGGTLFVAASDATATSIAAAQYVCDGTNDEVEIQQAYADILATGGSIVLSEGIFNIVDDILIASGALREVEIRGTAAASPWFPDSLATSLRRHSTSTSPIMTIAAQDVTVSNIYFANDSSSLTPLINGSNAVFRARLCGFDVGSTQRSVQLTSSDAHIERCHFEGGQANIHLTNCYMVSINDCYFYSNGADEYCVEIVGNDHWDEQLIQVLNCFSDGNSYGVVRATTMSGLLVAGNNFWYDEYPAIAIDDCSGVTISGNLLGEGGILLENIEAATGGVQVVSNHLYNVNTDGIDLNNCQGCSVVGNHIANASSTIDTKSAIILRGNTDDCLVATNMVRADGSAFKYGIRVDAATCNTNLVYGNDVKGCATTATFSDLGTGTITTAANRT